MAWTPEQEQRRRRRRRLIRGLVVGGAALGLPALANVLVARRAKALPPPEWGTPDLYDWRDGTVAFRRLGSGPPIVLLHSFGVGHSSLEWRATAQLLAGSYEVIVPDLLGWGDSDKPSRTYDGELYNQLIADLVADVAGRRAVIATSGLSAAYAVQLAVDHPESVRGLALVAPMGLELHGDEPDIKDAIVHRLLRLPILGTSSLNVFTSRRGIVHHLEREVFADPKVANEDLVDAYYRASHLEGAHAALAAYLAGYLNHDVGDLLARLELPVWLAWGREARSPAVETADLWLRSLADGHLEVLEDASVQPHAERPLEFSEAFEGFLSSLRD